MEYITATEAQTDEIYDLVQEAIRTVYPLYYTKEAVDFFCTLHSRERIEQDILDGHMGCLVAEGVVVGTGCHTGSHLRRVYVRPDLRGKGYGSIIMDYLEKSINREYDRVDLDASLPAVHFYESRGYRTVKHDRCELPGGKMLVYEVMQKTLPQTVPVFHDQDNI